MTPFEDLKWRGLIKDITSPELEQKINEGGLTFYIGTDPTADSMHIGHLSSFLISTRLKQYGHHPILLIGEATGLIGDPRPTAERTIMPREVMDKNVIGLTNQAEKIFGFDIVNNFDWSKEINFIDFLRDYGKYFNVNYMLDKDIIRRRLDSGITYTEFSYMIMQALDFLYLYENRNCTLQVAGSDQWGNITAGVDLIRKKLNKEAYGFTMPLVTDRYGNKFGKSEGNALWLDKDKTSPYEIYQFFVNDDDELVCDHLKVFTFLSKEEIENIMEESNKCPEKRIAQKRLGYEVVKFLHGKEEADKAETTAIEVFNNKGVSDNMPILEVSCDTEINILDLMVQTNMSSSKSEARRLVEQGGVSINNEKISNSNYILNDFSKNIIFRKGKKNVYKITKK